MALPQHGNAGLVRANAWLAELGNDRFASIEEVASSSNIHPKVMREALKLAVLAPDIVTSSWRAKLRSSWRI